MSLNQIITSLNADGHVDVPAGWTQGKSVTQGEWRAIQPRGQSGYRRLGA